MNRNCQFPAHNLDFTTGINTMICQSRKDDTPYMSYDNRGIKDDNRCMNEDNRFMDGDNQ